MEPTYILSDELNEFVGEFKNRHDQHIDNIWVIKPVNLARGLDTIVTSNLDQILKVMEAGPKIAQKYIEHPLLYKGKKHDYRFIIPVRSIRPLEAYIYNTFWLRASNNSYTLDKLSLSEYETHFTVMNYRSKYKDCPDCKSYLEYFQENYGTKASWADIYIKIKKVIFDALVASQVLNPQFGKENVNNLHRKDLSMELTLSSLKILHPNSSNLPSLLIHPGHVIQIHHSSMIYFYAFTKVKSTTWSYSSKTYIWLSQLY